MKIATSTSDFARYVSSPANICEILPLLAESGFKHIDLSLGSCVYEGSPLREDGWERWVDDIGNAAAKLGLDFVQAHSSSVYLEGEARIQQIEMLKRQLQVCQKLGIVGTVVHAICNVNFDRQEFMVQNAAFYRGLLDTAEKTGVIVYTENSCTRNGIHYHLVAGSDYCELENIVGKHPLFGCCWDVGHAHIQGLNQYDEILTMGAGLKAVHIHDNSLWDSHQMPYTGNCNYDAIVKGLVDVGYDGYFTMEAGLMKREAYERDGVVYDKLRLLPLAYRIRTERLMYDIARYMLESYDCFEE